MVTDRQLRSLRHRGFSAEMVAKRHPELTADQVRERWRQMWTRAARETLADPNELLISLWRSAIQLTWSEAEERRRRGRLEPDEVGITRVDVY